MVSKRRALIEKWFEGFTPYTRDSVPRYWAPECRLELPRSPEFIPSWDQDTLRAFEAQWEDIAKGATFDVHDYIEDDQNNKAAILYTCTFTFYPELEISDYKGTYVMIFHFNETQDAIVRFMEVADYANTPNILRKIEEGRKKKGLAPLSDPSAEVKAQTFQ
ncbi:uncharacterized protein Z518_03592 [Rhinocladiella mackenziei CBS 650.93]|uniref:SnoaL-like domain-containing protein n=1 Tax=Rhinocladiella mackenziei CBS 650.93 TaxID=1442369 RepID=A0A0D2J925_9EURO|nr:uncharacterized protein Z518_03592 [Rhinocladiella mackenziei CBS 650.93]KIX05620.1 hypothetical protein Z518_03592 [Rhinocladiella mackenziei CBS 650.93]